MLRVLAAVVCCSGVGIASYPANGQRTGRLTLEPGGTGQDSSDEVTVTVGKAVLMNFAQPIQRIAVGSSEIAEATATSPLEVMLNGKAPGETSLIVWQRGGDRHFLTVKVRRSLFETNERLEAVRRELRKELPGEKVTVSLENGSVFLRGTVADLVSSERAVAIASTALIAGGSDPGKGASAAATADATSGKVVNLLYVDVPKAERQIALKVRFASLDRTKARQMGLNLFSLGLGNTVGGISTGQFTPPMVTGGSGSGGVTSSGYQATFTNELNFLAFFPGLNGGADIQALETQGVVEVLAQPNVVASDGRQASFLAGGEYPYPVAQAGSAGSGPTITIMFKEYGVRLNFIPTITPRGTIRLQVAPEVSSLDFSNAVTVSGFTVPAISSRKVKTEVELAQGQSFMIGGLIDKRESETFEKIPFIGDVPVLGKFFQSKAKSRTNTELIVLVTPELVDPLPEGETLPAIQYPEKFLPEKAGAAPSTLGGKPSEKAAAPKTIPVEKLIDSTKPEKPLVIDAGFSPGVGSSSSSAGASGGASPPR